MFEHDATTLSSMQRYILSASGRRSDSGALVHDWPNVWEFFKVLNSRIRKVEDIETILTNFFENADSLKLHFIFSSTHDFQVTIADESRISLRFHYDPMDDQQITNLVNRCVPRVFEADQGPMATVDVFRERDTDWSILAVFDHLVADFYSMSLISAYLGKEFNRSGEVIPSIPSVTQEPRSPRFDADFHLQLIRNAPLKPPEFMMTDSRRSMKLLTHCHVIRGHSFTRLIKLAAYLSVAVETCIEILYINWLAGQCQTESVALLAHHGRYPTDAFRFGCRTSHEPILCRRSEADDLLAVKERVVRREHIYGQVWVGSVDGYHDAMSKIAFQLSVLSLRGTNDPRAIFPVLRMKMYRYPVTPMKENIGKTKNLPLYEAAIPRITVSIYDDRAEVYSQTESALHLPLARFEEPLMASAHSDESWNL